MVVVFNVSSFHDRCRNHSMNRSSCRRCHDFSIASDSCVSFRGRDCYLHVRGCCRRIRGRVHRRQRLMSQCSESYRRESYRRVRCDCARNAIGVSSPSSLSCASYAMIPRHLRRLRHRRDRGLSLVPRRQLDVLGSLRLLRQ